MSTSITCAAFFVALFFFSGVLADSCSEKTDCDTCLFVRDAFNFRICGFCSKNNTCLSLALGDATCPSDSWNTDPDKCRSVSSKTLAVVIGVAVGGAALLLAVGGFWYCRRQKALAKHRARQTHLAEEHKRAQERKLEHEIELTEHNRRYSTMPPPRPAASHQHQQQQQQIDMSIAAAYTQRPDSSHLLTPGVHPTAALAPSPTDPSADPAGYIRAVGADGQVYLIPAQSVTAVGPRISVAAHAPRMSVAQPHHMQQTTRPSVSVGPPPGFQQQRTGPSPSVSIGQPKGYQHQHQHQQRGGLAPGQPQARPSVSVGPPQGYGMQQQQQQQQRAGPSPSVSVSAPLHFQQRQPAPSPPPPPPPQQQQQQFLSPMIVATPPQPHHQTVPQTSGFSIQITPPTLSAPAPSPSGAFGMAALREDEEDADLPTPPVPPPPPPAYDGPSFTSHTLQHLPPAGPHVLQQQQQRGQPRSPAPAEPAPAVTHLDMRAPLARGQTASDA